MVNAINKGRMTISLFSTKTWRQKTWSWMTRWRMKTRRDSKKEEMEITS
jgi:hypothetical protein